MGARGGLRNESIAKFGKLNRTTERVFLMICFVPPAIECLFGHQLYPIYPREIPELALKIFFLDGNWEQRLDI